MDDEPRADGPDERSRSGAFQNACNQGAFTCGTCGYSYSHVFSVGGVCIDCDADQKYERERRLFIEAGFYLGVRRRGIGKLADYFELDEGQTRPHGSKGIYKTAVAGVRVRSFHDTMVRINRTITGKYNDAKRDDEKPLPHSAVMYAYRMPEHKWFREYIGRIDLRASDAEVIVLRETIRAAREAWREGVHRELADKRLTAWICRAMHKAAIRELHRCVVRSRKRAETERGRVHKKSLKKSRIADTDTPEIAPTTNKQTYTHRLAFANPADKPPKHNGHGRSRVAGSPRAIPLRGGLTLSHSTNEVSQ